MARVTVEDCITILPNRFELVTLAAQRAKELAAGAMLTVQRDKDKNPVVALREIAEKNIPVETLRETIIRGLQHNLPVEDNEEDIAAVLAEDQKNAQEDTGDVFMASIEEDAVAAEIEEADGFLEEDDVTEDEDAA